MTTTTADVEAYTAQVRAALADLPDAARDDLLADLADHLAEVAGEDPDRPLADLLGPPADYAAELRSSAGLAAPPGSGRVGMDRTVRKFRELPLVASVLAFLPELRPGWWVARALLTGTAVTAFLHGGPALWLLLAVVLVPASVALGRWTAARRTRRPLTIGVDVLAAVVLLAVLGSATDATWGYRSGVDVGPVLPEGPGADLLNVTNLLPYDEQGRPLTGVRLYDQDGKPVELRIDADPNGNPITRVPRYTIDGQVIGNAYPQEQTVEEYPLDSGTTPTVRPVQTPALRPPALRSR